MSQLLIIIGASGHGKVVADVAALLGYSDIAFLDGNPFIKTCGGYPVIGLDSEADNIEGDLFIAVGNSRIRQHLMDKHNHRHFPVLIHPNAVVAHDVQIEAGSVIMAGVVINTSVKIGRGVIVNTASSIDHDCEIEDFSHIAVGAHLAGAVYVGAGTWIGAGSVISNNVNICEACTIGAGAVVIKDIKIPGTYVGVPAKMIKITPPPPT